MIFIRNILRVRSEHVRVGPSYQTPSLVCFIEMLMLVGSEMVVVTDAIAGRAHFSRTKEN
jgi:hypothetical protein